MHTLRILPVALLAICVATPPLFAADAAVADTQDGSTSSRVPYVTPAAVQAWLDAGQGVTFLDVRQADEFVAGHIPGAMNIHYDQVDSLATRLSLDESIVIYCIHSAHRAPEAAKTLRHLGFQNVYVMEGGIVAWQAEELPIRASDLAQAPKILPKTERCDFQPHDQQQLSQKP